MIRVTMIMLADTDMEMLTNSLFEKVNSKQDSR